MRIGIVTSFPNGHAPKSGIAYYAKTIVAPLAEGPDDITVFADRVDGIGRPRDRAKRAMHPPEHRDEHMGKSVRILRCWRFGMLSPFVIARAIVRHRLDVLHIEYDVYQFGGVVVAVLLPIVLMALRKVRGFQTVTTLHGVVPQCAVTGEMLRENGFVLPFSHIGKLGFQIVYRLFNMASDRVIVLEHKLADILTAEYAFPREKVFVVPIPLMNAHPHVKQVDTGSSAIDDPMQFPLNDAAPSLPIGDKSVIFVGYASYYKGLPILLEAFDIVRRKDPAINLHVVAGRHPRLAGDPRYENFYRGLMRRAAEVNAMWHGFVSDEELALMLSASAAVIFPYTAAYGASAALNTALAARRPVLVSSVVYFQGALPGQVFEPNCASCAAAILRFFDELRPELEARVEDFARHRDASYIARQVHRVRLGLDIAALPQAQPRELASHSAGDRQS